MQRGPSLDRPAPGAAGGRSNSGPADREPHSAGLRAGGRLGRAARWIAAGALAALGAPWRRQR
eukprot:1783752-Lingulodinium_polyedra.AAC.1